MKWGPIGGIIHSRSFQELVLDARPHIRFVLGRTWARTYLVSDERLERSPDLGWSAYVPVHFDTMWDALRLGITPGKRVSSTAEITLSVNLFPEDRKRQRRPAKLSEHRGR